MAKTYYVCMNPSCGEMMLGSEKEVKKYCGHCNTAEKRKKQDEENAEIKKKSND